MESEQPALEDEFLAAESEQPALEDEFLTAEAEQPALEDEFFEAEPAPPVEAAQPALEDDFFEAEPAPPVESEQPALEDEFLAAESEQPALEDEFFEAEPAPPVESEQPALEDEFLAVESEQPALEDEFLAAESEPLAVEQERTIEDDLFAPEPDVPESREDRVAEGGATPPSFEDALLSAEESTAEPVSEPTDTYQAEIDAEYEAYEPVEQRAEDEMVDDGYSIPDDDIVDVEEAIHEAESVVQHHYAEDIPLVMADTVPDADTAVEEEIDVSTVDTSDIEMGLETAVVDVGLLEEMIASSTQMVLAQVHLDKNLGHLTQLVDSLMRVHAGMMASIDPATLPSPKGSGESDMPSDIFTQTHLAADIPHQLWQDAGHLGEFLNQLQRVSTAVRTNINELNRTSAEIIKQLQHIHSTTLYDVFESCEKLVAAQASAAGKDVQVSIKKTGIVIDKTLAADLKSIFEPLLKIMVADIESLEEREAREKSLIGEITFSAWTEHGQTIIQLQSDGGGNLQDDIGGWRDYLAVRLDGLLEVEVMPEEGLVFQMRIPNHHEVVPALFVKIGQHLYVFPVAKVEGWLKLPVADLNTHDNHHYFTFRDQEIPLIELSAAKSTEKTELSVLIFTDSTGTLGFAVDQILGEREVIIERISQLQNQEFMVINASLVQEPDARMIIDYHHLV
ncbi:MAG: hypothetical protein D6675_16535 [Gemmatimonadetes bacterium]|nr:MAG: hypothetical protein D6675_16535 [Gemmatimonadota bacterium]